MKWSSNNKIDSEATLGLTGTSNSLSYRVHEIERHIHSSGRWFGTAETPTATHFADRIGATGLSAGEPDAFVIDAGNDTWGNWVQLFGSDDTPANAGKTYFDPHEMVINAAERAATYFIQIGRGASGAATLAAGTYTELVLDTVSRSGGNIISVQSGRAPAGNLLWARCMSPGNDTGIFSFYMGIHEYEG
jgi:hypothetical protein